MSASALLPLLLLSSSFVPGMIIFGLSGRLRRLRSALNLTGAVLKVGLVGWLTVGLARGASYELRFEMLPGIDFVLHADPLAVLLLALSAVLWLVTTVYAIAYLEGSPNRARFFGFFSLCVTATVGLAMAGNLVTFLLFYELLSLSTYPLVVHRGTDVARRAGRTYLIYTLIGGALLLAGIAWLYGVAGTLEFTPRGFVAGLGEERHAALVAIFVLMIAGVGVKGALVPLHGWLPQAMVAPAPVSALLHAVAVVKAGAFGIVRIVRDVFGIEFAASLGVLTPLAVVAAVTILYGSARALSQQDIKRRLAFSTVSQVSYIALGTAVLGPTAAIGGLVHLVHQGIMKITLFFCAGNLAETLDIHEFRELRGVARRMPWTMAAFTVAACGMIGLPPTVGFVSKWYLGLGALEAGAPWVLAVLIGSSLLNAAYFLPPIYAAWFAEPERDWPRHAGHGRAETSLGLLLPTLFTAALVIVFGVLAAAPFSPLRWVQFIAEQGFTP